MRLSRYTHFADHAEGTVIASLLSRRAIDAPRRIAHQISALVPGSSWQKLDEIAPELKFELITGLFCVPDDFDEWSYIRERHRHSAASTTQLNVVIAPTMGCNMSCHYCFETHEPGDFSTEHVDSLCAIIESRLENYEALHVQWFGGEPLIAMDSIEVLSDRLGCIANNADKPFSAEIITNGVLMDSSVSRRLIQLGVSRAQVTFDGDRSLHDRVRRMPGGGSSFDRILQNVRNAPPDLAVNARIHVAPYTIEGCFTLLDQLAQGGLQSHLASVYFAPLFSYQPKRGENGFREDARRFLTAEKFASIQTPLLAKARALGFRLGDPLDAGYDICTAMQQGSLVVAANGTISKCYLEAGERSLGIGTLDGAVNQDTARRWSGFEFAKDPECHTCHVAPVCLGGCPKENMSGADLSVTCSPLRYNLADRLRLAYGSEAPVRQPDFLFGSGRMFWDGLSKSTMVPGG